ncbi:hypothetical protein K457DRAFT_129225 [Linnemannia elongata AG-77]|uniref:Uncharacterized protein n=1 Tax=Linnemannia elongata AG-77 TaxID=1314771 RepID=A0A197JJH2_9FUNG|nr:hypothetical protein K457DRAFT_129225 [Linnemannia elongata AG-77]
MRLPHGAPDVVCLRAGGDPKAPESVLFPIEIKVPLPALAGFLRSENLVVDFMAQEQVGAVRGPARALKQMFGYMYLDGYRYGVLSTYEQTWFLKPIADDLDLDPPSKSDEEMIIADENRPDDKRQQDNSQHKPKKGRFEGSTSSLTTSGTYGALRKNTVRMVSLALA